MHMYDQLFSLATDGPLTMQIVADATNHTLTINVIPQPTDQQAARAARALSLTATPDEFAADFCTALRDYQCAHHALLAQAVAQIQAVRTSSGKLAVKPSASSTSRAPTLSTSKAEDRNVQTGVPPKAEQPTTDNDLEPVVDAAPSHMQPAQRPAPVQTALFS